MMNINLSSDDNLKKTSKPTRGVFDAGTIISFAVIFAVLAVWGGALFYKSTVESKIKQTEAEIDFESKQVNDEDVNRIVDFQKRLLIVEKNIKGKNSHNEILDKVAAAIIKGSYVDSYSYSAGENSISLSLVSDGIEGAARQIAAFKKSGSAQYFSNLEAMGSFAQDEDGEVKHEIGAVLSGGENNSGEEKDPSVK